MASDPLGLEKATARRPSNDPLGLEADAASESSDPLGLEGRQKPLTEQEARRFAPIFGVPEYAQPVAKAIVSNPILQAAGSLITEPVVRLAGPEAPLTAKMFDETFVGGMDPRAETIVRPVTDALIKLAPEIAGFMVGGPATRPIRLFAAKLGRATLGDILTGGAIGAASGAASAAVKDEPVLPATAAGSIFGVGLGALIGGATNAARALQAHIARNTIGVMPSIHKLDEVIPHVRISDLEREAREVMSGKKGEAARRAWLRIIPKNADKESIPPALGAEARHAASKAAVEAGEDFEGLAREGLFLNSVQLTKGVDEVKDLWGRWVTNLGATLFRDRAAFKDVGVKLFDKIKRAEELKDPLEGSLVADMWRPMWNGVAVEELPIIHKVLIGEGGQLSVPGSGAVQMSRRMFNDAFDEMSGLGLREAVAPTHPGARGHDLFEQMEMFGPPSVPGKEGLIFIPIQKRTNYTPVYRDERALAAIARPGSKERAVFLSDMVKRGEAEDLRDAAAKLKTFLQADAERVPWDIRTGFQHERDMPFTLPSLSDPKAYTRRYIHEYARRVAQAKVFGPQDELYEQLRSELLKKGGDVKRLDRIFQIYIGRTPADDMRMANAARTARSYVATSMLGPRVFPLQFLQLSNTAGLFGWKKLLSGISGGWRVPALREAAEEVGALLPSQMLMSEIEPINMWAQWWVQHVTQMPRGDAMARTVSAISGGVAARQWAQEYWQLANSPGARTVRQGLGGALKYIGIRNRAERMLILARRLEEDLGLPARIIMENEGQLSIDAVRHAMRTASHRTQFGSTILDFPEMRTSPAGRFMFSLRTFAKQQSTLVKSLASRAIKGDTGPIIRYISTYGALYAALAPLLDALSSRNMVDEANEEALDQVRTALEGAMWTGMMGGVGDFINQMGASDPGKIFGYMAGPAVGLGVGTLADVSKAARGDANPLVRRAIRYSPGGSVTYPLLQRILENQ